MKDRIALAAMVGSLMTAGAMPAVLAAGEATGAMGDQTMDESASSTGGASTAGTSGESSVASDAVPVVVLVPHVFAYDPTLADGCWARLYDEDNFEGNTLSLVGPVNVPGPNIGARFELGREYDSVQVGPNAELAVFDNQDYQQRTATFDSGQKVADLDEDLGYFENIRSLKLSCTGEAVASAE